MQRSSQEAQRIAKDILLGAVEEAGYEIFMMSETDETDVDWREEVNLLLLEIIKEGL